MPALAATHLVDENDLLVLDVLVVPQVLVHPLLDRISFAERDPGATALEREVTADPTDGLVREHHSGEMMHMIG
eukprot:COSAG04_NODE_160_length_22034_cov_4.774151_11_plen_74_part_00